MQDWTATARNRVKQKKPDKNGKHIGKPIRNNLNIKGTC